MTDIEKLATCSAMAMFYAKNYELIDIDEYRESHPNVYLTFHPNGNCGCIQSNDDYVFGIRCDHLMWAEGNCEGEEDFWNENDRKVAKEKIERNNGYEAFDIYRAILIYGNHKGILLTKLLASHEKE